MQVDWRKVLKDTGYHKNKMRSMTPEALLHEFNRHPSDDLQRKVDFFYLPYNTKIDCSKHMRFHTDYKLDQLDYLRKLYLDEKLDQKEKAFISNLISRVTSGDPKLVYDESKWDMLF